MLLSKCFCWEFQAAHYFIALCTSCTGKSPLISSDLVLVMTISVAYAELQNKISVSGLCTRSNHVYMKQWASKKTRTISQKQMNHRYVVCSQILCDQLWYTVIQIKSQLNRIKSRLYPPHFLFHPDQWLTYFSPGLNQPPFEPLPFLLENSRISIWNRELYNKWEMDSS